MKSLLFFLVPMLWTSISVAQPPKNVASKTTTNDGVEVSITSPPVETPMDAIFKRYSDKIHVNVSIDNLPVEKDSAIKIPLSTMVKTMTVRNDEEDKEVAKLLQKITKDCAKILSRKGYVLVSMDQDDHSSDKTYKYEKGNVVEICELEQDEDEFTLTLTQISGLSKEMKDNFKIKTEKKTIGTNSH